MTMRIDGGQPKDNKTGFSMEQLKGMTKQQLLTVFDTNNSGTLSDKELNSKGMTGEEISELKGYMKEVGIEQEVRTTKTGLSLEQLLAMTKEELVTIFDKNNNGTISGKEIAEKGLAVEDAADVQALVKALGIEEAEKAEKSSAVAKNSTVAATNSTKKPKSTQATTQSTAMRRDHRPKQVPLGHVPRKVTLPKDIRIPKEATVHSNKLAGENKVKKGNWYFSYNCDGKVEAIYRADKNGKCAEKKTFYIDNYDDKFSYREYNSNGKKTFFYYSSFDKNYNTRDILCDWSTYEYDNKGRVIRSIEYDENGKPTRLDEIKYDNDKAYHTVYWENQLDELKPGQVLPKKAPDIYSVDVINIMFNVN